MTPGYLTIIANEPHFAEILKKPFQKTAGQEPRICSFASDRDQVGPGSNGVVLVATQQAAEFGLVSSLVQEISLKKLPPPILILGGEAASHSDELASLDAFLSYRLNWPEDASILEKTLKSRLRAGRSISWPKEESLGDVISRRLLCYTPSLQTLAEPIGLAATHDVPVLITGETGTGKTHLAKLIHQFSARKDRRFLVVPCGALAANLIESEFFGHTKGAFTGADRAKEGKFATAGDGTILLDEIDVLEMGQQANLLRVIETGEYEPVGSNQTKHCDARIIAASNCNLDEVMEAGKFRQDLYYRLHVMAFHLPPLRERIQDIEPLTRGLASFFNRKFNKGLFDIHPEVITALEKFPWPGNIRQLENVIQQAVLVSNGPELLLSHLSPFVRNHAIANDRNVENRSTFLAHDREEVERVAIQKALDTFGNSRTKAAHALGISRVTLYHKMKKYGLMGPKGRATIPV